MVFKQAVHLGPGRVFKQCSNSVQTDHSSLLRIILGVSKTDADYTDEGSKYEKAQNNLLSHPYEWVHDITMDAVSTPGVLFISALKS